MNLDYVREVVNDRDIDIPFARPALVKQAGLVPRPARLGARVRRDPAARLRG